MYYLKNDTSPKPLSAHIKAAVDGSPVTEGVSVKVSGVTGAGTLTHVSDGEWKYTPTQAETNADAFTVRFEATGALTVLYDVHTISTNLGSGVVNVVSPVSSSGIVELVRGDDYDNADGRALDFTNPDGTWPDLTDATITFKAAKGSALIEATGTVVTATGANQQVRVELTAEEIGTKYGHEWQYNLRATLDSGNEVTLQRGRLNVLADVPA